MSASSLALCLTLLMGCLYPTEAEAQLNPAPDAVEVARLVRQEHHTGRALDVLTQRGVLSTQAERDAIADTIVAIILSDAPYAAKRPALYTLINASMGEGGARYEGGAVRMYKIAVADDSLVSAGMVVALERLPVAQERLHFVRLTATSRARVAERAVLALGSEMGDEGLRVAKELYDQGSVREEHATALLERFALIHGWKRTSG